MSKLRNGLTDTKIRKWVDKRERIAGKGDGGGLTFTLSAAGTASWVFRYRLHGRAKELTLGNYPDITLQQARKLATKARAEVDQGVDVANQKRDEKAAKKMAGTIAELSEQFVAEAIRTSYKNPGVVEGLLRRDVLPVIGRLAPLDVRQNDVDRVLRRVKSDGRLTVANDALRVMRNMFRWGKKRGLLDHNPAADFDISDAGGKEPSRDRKLSREEISKLFAAMSAGRRTFGRDNELATKLLLALGVRKMELLAAQWSEFDLDAGIWYLPGDRTKTGKPIDVPLAPSIVEWLRELKVRACDNNYVFPARRVSKAKRFPHVSPDTLNFAFTSLDHKLEHFTVHDFRRTMRSELSALGVAPHIAERCLNHAIKGVEGRYDRHSYFDERQHALAIWADLLQTLERGEHYNVFPFSARSVA